MADLKISQLTAKGSAIAATDLVEISESDGAGGYVTKSVTGANIKSGLQTTLVSGTNIKTVEGQSILGTGNIDINKTDVGLGLVDNTSDLSKPISTATQTALNAKQDTLVSATNIKTINSTTILGSGDLAVQPTLVSGTNIKTINSNSILGSGDLVITGGVTSVSATTPVVATGTTTPVISLATGYGDTQNPYASKTANNILAAPNGTAGVPTFRAIVGADIPTLNQNTTGTAANVTGIVALANGGTGTATPSLVAGTNVTITGTFPNQTITALSGGGTQIGALIGGGIVVGVFVEGGVNKALVASLTNLSTGLVWTVPAQQSIGIGATAQNLSDGLSNTNAIIAQTGAAATTAYAAGIARLFAGGGFSDWYLPSAWELNMCYNSATVVNRILGAVNGFIGTIYWSSNESTASTARNLDFLSGTYAVGNKGFVNYVRAVRIHTI